MVLSSQPIRVVLFDMGNTLHAKSSVKAGANANYQFIADRFGKPFLAVKVAVRRCSATALATARMQPFYLFNDVLKQSFRQGLKEIGVKASEEDLAQIHANFWQETIARARPEEGAVDTLTGLRDRGVKVGIVSVSDEKELQQIVDACGVREHVEFVLTSESAGSCKPHSPIFDQALKLADAVPNETLFVGDAKEFDTIGANRMGMRTAHFNPDKPLHWFNSQVWKTRVLVPRGRPVGVIERGVTESEADNEIHKLTEILAIVDKSARALT